MMRAARAFLVDSFAACLGGYAARTNVAAAEPLVASPGSHRWLWRLLKRGDVDADSILSQRVVPASAAERCDGCGGAGSTGACQALFRGSHEALRTRCWPVVG